MARIPGWERDAYDIFPGLPYCLWHCQDGQHNCQTRLVFYEYLSEHSQEMMAAHEQEHIVCVYKDR